MSKLGIEIYCASHTHSQTHAKLTMDDAILIDRHIGRVI